MPELPEVQTITDEIRPHLLDKKIIGLKINVPRFFYGDKALLHGSKIESVNRRAKVIVFGLSNKNFAVLHLKMSGRLLFNKKPDKYTRAVFTFSDGSKLLFNDIRRFGYVRALNPEQFFEFISRFGPEPLDKSFKLNGFIKNLNRHNKMRIKAYLLNQGHVAGIGNIYADEILFRARVNPGTKIEKISLKQREKIFDSIKKVLSEAVTYMGTTFQNYRRPNGGSGEFALKLRVYGREGLSCLRGDGGIIKRVVVAGRSTVFCPRCQK